MRMKSLILSVLLCICFINSGVSQFSFKTFLGVNSAWHTTESDLIFTPEGSSTVNSEKVLLPFLGLQIQIHNQFGRPIDFNFETKLTYKGRYEEEFDYTLKIIYIELTPSVDIQIYKQFRFAVGPYLSKKIGLSENYVQGVERGYIKGWDVGGAVSFSYSFKNLLVRLGYSHGKTIIEEDRFRIEEVFNRSIEFGLGYTLFTKKRKIQSYY